MNIDELYSEYRRCSDEKILIELVKQGQRYCMHIYKKERNTFWAVPNEGALEIAEEQALFCSKRCLKEEVQCFKRCLVAYFKWRMLDAVEKLIADQDLVYADDIKQELRLDESKISDDEAFSSVHAGTACGTEVREHMEWERWHDIERHLKSIEKFEAEVFTLSFMHSPEEIAKITGKSKNQVAKAKSSAKKQLMEALGSEKE